MTEKQARSMARRHTQAARAGWLMACVARTNKSKGEAMLATLGQEDRDRAAAYRDYCIELYAKHERVTP